MSRSHHMELFLVRHKSDNEVSSVEPTAEAATIICGLNRGFKWEKIVVPLRREELAKFLTDFR